MAFCDVRGGRPLSWTSLNPHACAMHKCHRKELLPFPSHGFGVRQPQGHSHLVPSTWIVTQYRWGKPSDSNGSPICITELISVDLLVPSSCYDEILGQKQLQGRGICLRSQFKTIQWQGRHSDKNLRGLVTVCPQSGRRKQWMLMINLLYPFNRVRDQVWGPLYWPNQVHPHRHAWMLSSSVILDSVKFRVNINHQ